MKTDQHTPTPWLVEKVVFDKHYTGVITDANKKYLGEMSAPQNGKGDSSPIANAAFIVHCVNHFEEVCAALKDVLHDGLKLYNGGQEHKADIMKAREVLAKAEGK